MWVVKQLQGGEDSEQIVANWEPLGKQRKIPTPAGTTQRIVMELVKLRRDGVSLKPHLNLQKTVHIF